MAHLIPFAYHHGNTALHRLDVRLKFFMICLISISLVSARVWPCLVYGLVLGVCLKQSKTNIFQLLRTLKLFLLLLGFVFLTRCLTTDGYPLVHVFGLSITAQGIQAGFTVALKFFLVMITGLVFALTTRPSAVKSAVQWYLKPVPLIPEKRVAVMISLSLSFMPVLLKHFGKISDAQAARCGNLEKNPVKRIIRLVFPLLKKTFLSADHLINAMESRCYADDRTDPEFTVSGREPVFFLGSIVLAAGLAVL